MANGNLNVVRTPRAIMRQSNKSIHRSPNRKTQNGVDRRASVRYSSGRSCGCHSIGDDQEKHWPAIVRDVSSEGLNLVVCRAFRAGEFLTVELDDATEGMRKRLFVRVKHAAAQGDGVWSLGCRLVSRLRRGELEQFR